MLTVAEVAQTCGVSRNTVWKWVRAGILQVTRFGPRCVRVRREDFDRMIARSSRS